jgi:hypothetical protein
MIVLDLSILNQKGTPMFNSDLTANRPAAGIVGRIFIATDSPYGIFRDTGTAWDSIAGASTFSGSLGTGQVAFGSATNTISGTNNLFWDAANQRLGIGTNTPLYKIDNTGTLRTSYTTINAAGDGVIQIYENANSYINIGYSGGIGNGNFRIQRILSGVASGEISLSNGGSFLWSGSSSMYMYNTGQLLSGSALEINFRNRVGINYAPVQRDNMLTIKGNNVGGNANILTTLTDVNIQALNVFSTGNVGINANNVDAGQRFQVYGDSFLKGSGATSATTALNIQDSAALSMFRVRNDNRVFINQLALGNDFLEIIPTTTGSTYDINGGSFAFVSSQANYGLASYNFYFRHVYAGRVNTSGTSGGILQTLGFSPTSGTGIFNQLRLTGTINQTGGANGISRGLYVDPVLTAAADWRSIEWSNNTGWGIYGAGTALSYFGGSVGIKTTAPYVPSTFSLDVNGGLLVKNTAGTTAQITLINADPSTGGNNGFLVQTVGGTSGGSYVDFQGYYGTSIVGSTALRLNPAGGAVIVNSTTNTGEQFQLTGTLRINGQSSGTAGGSSGQHLIINLDGTTYKIALLNP